MSREYFSKHEAKKLVGCLVRSKSGLESIPEGTSGIITRIVSAGLDRWMIRVDWQLGRKSAEYFAMLGEYSFNFRWPSKIVTHEFAKDNFASLTRVHHAGVR